MLKKLFPRNDNFFIFFEKHAAISVQAANELLRFTEPNCDTQQIFQNIKACELQGDVIAHQCLEALHKNFITPLERADIHHLISTMDDVLDEIEDVGKFLLLYKLTMSQEGAKQMAHLLLKSTIQMEMAVKELRKMKHTKAIQTHFFNINHLENEGDALFIQSLGKLLENGNDTFFFMKWKEIYEHLEHAIDACEDVVNILEGIVLEYD